MLVDPGSYAYYRIVFPEPVEPPTKKSPLELELADLYIAKNAAAHHTADFNVVYRENDKNLVIRRGQPFEILLSFYRDVDADVDELKLVFEIGSHPTIANSTRVIMTVPLQERAENQEVQSWYATVKKLTGTQLLLKICVPPNCIVGCWNLKVVTSLKACPTNQHLKSTSLISDIYILFNPWNKDDVVFMESEDVEEYVLNDVGKIWRGSSNCPTPCFWSFGQFEEGILEACISVLNRSALPFPLRSSPAFVVRAMSDMVRCFSLLTSHAEIL
ncbi:transglutaminase family protein [Trichuris suis]|nr:transglutaminase family protein [Trichuris suis]